ncbi:MAG: ROK family protein [Caulobacteraceae bacterium]
MNKPAEQSCAVAPMVKAGPPANAGARLGLDLGGTKIAAAVLGADGAIMQTRRIPNPGEYGALIRAVRDLADGLVAPGTPIGMGIPGSVSPTTGLVRNCNATWINGHDLARDLAEGTGRDVRLANDADCFVLSETRDGAAVGARVVFGVIIGTGVGGGVAVDGALLPGAGGISGEWGHIPLPWAAADEYPGPSCWCGLSGCMEIWASGPALEREHGQGLRAPDIAAKAAQGDPHARATLERYISRLGRGLAVICNVLDPEVIVLGGGMSNVDELYDALPKVMAKHMFTDELAVRVLRNRHGDASGVRGAAWLWPHP